MHWEIDTVEGIKDKEGCVLLTLIERKNLNSIHRKLPGKIASAVEFGEIHLIEKMS